MKTIALFGSLLLPVAACGGSSDPGDENGSGGNGGSGAISSGGSAGSKATGGSSGSSATGGTGNAGGKAGAGGSAGTISRGGSVGQGGRDGGAGGAAGASAGGGGTTAGGRGGAGGNAGVAGEAGEGGAPGEDECPPQRPAQGAACQGALSCTYLVNNGCLCLDSLCTVFPEDCGVGGASGRGAFAPPANGGVNGDRVPIAGTSGIVPARSLPCACVREAWSCAMP